jgi:hypothetical protein
MTQPNGVATVPIETGTWFPKPGHVQVVTEYMLPCGCVVRLAARNVDGSPLNMALTELAQSTLRRLEQYIPEHKCRSSA